MIRTRIAVWLLADEYVDAFREWAEARNTEVVVLDAFPARLPVSGPLALGAVEVSGGEAACVERLRSLLTQTGPCPVVALGSDIGVESAVALMRQGACDVIELPAPPADVVERAVASARLGQPAEGELDRPLRPGADPRRPGNGFLVPRSYPGNAPEGSEKERIASALISTGGNIARAARRLDLPRSTLRYRIQRHSLSSLIPND